MTGVRAAWVGVSVCWRHQFAVSIISNTAIRCVFASLQVAVTTAESPKTSGPAGPSHEPGGPCIPCAHLQGSTNLRNAWRQAAQSPCRSSNHLCCAVQGASGPCPSRNSGSFCIGRLSCDWDFIGTGPASSGYSLLRLSVFSGRHEELHLIDMFSRNFPKSCIIVCSVYMYVYIYYAHPQIVA